MKTARSPQRVLSRLALACGLFPALALAAPPFANSGTQLKADLVQTLTPFAGIAVLVVGVAMMFGSDQIVTWFRTLMGV